MATFFSYSAESRIKKGNKLLKMNKIINWKKISKKLKGFYKKDIEDKGGKRPYDTTKMFKCLLLGQWYSLSDPELEEALCVRLDFMLFTGFELLENCPDETTICRFRNKLIDLGLEEILFKEINLQLEDLGLKVKNCEGAVLDATIIESAARPKKQIEIQQDRKEEKASKKMEISESKDPDSKWLKKGKKYYFGYKSFVAVDREKGFISKVHITPANISEVSQFPEIINGLKTKRIYTDKGYTSSDNRKLIKEKKLKDGIMHKKTRGKNLTVWQKLKNKLISKKRYIVEQCFGTLKRRFKFRRASYIGIVKVKAQMYLKAICFNLLKAVKMIEIT